MRSSSPEVRVRGTRVAYVATCENKDCGLQAEVPNANGRDCEECGGPVEVVRLRISPVRDNPDHVEVKRDVILNDVDNAK